MTIEYGDNTVIFKDNNGIEIEYDLQRKGNEIFGFDLRSRYMGSVISSYNDNGTLASSKKELLYPEFIKEYNFDLESLEIDTNIELFLNREIRLWATMGGDTEDLQLVIMNSSLNKYLHTLLIKKDNRIKKYLI